MTIGMPDYSSTPENFKVMILRLHSELTLHRNELIISCFSQNLMQVVVCPTIHFICMTTFPFFFFFVPYLSSICCCKWYFICMLDFVKGLSFDPKALGLLDTDLVKPSTFRILTFHHSSESNIHSSPLYRHWSNSSCFTFWQLHYQYSMTSHYTHTLYQGILMEHIGCLLCDSYPWRVACSDTKGVTIDPKA
jgi:hypothetical protein